MLVYQELKSTDKIPNHELRSSYLWLGMVLGGLAVCLVGYLS